MAKKSDRRRHRAHPFELNNLSPQDLRRIAEACYGQPTFSNGCELRWGRRGSLSFNLHKRLFFDYEAGCGGNIIDLVIHAGLATDFQPAIRFIEDALGGNSCAAATFPVVSTPTVDYAQRIREMWSQTLPIQGSVAQTYLESRALPGPWPTSLRFHPALYCAEAGIKLPALVGAVCGVSKFEIPCAVQRLWLAPDGKKSDLRSPKKALGPTAGHAIILGDIAETVCIAEGIESALSASRALKLPSIATLGTSGMIAVQLPENIKRAVIAYDRDANGAGEIAARTLAAILYSEGRGVKLAPPPKNFKDWNEYAIGKRND